ncbi:hypothetical protein SBA4_3530011 [Candidatus Sulfopaludibacter sp. SbA4]|nr:hypothetical protein SBA4_3530011 [Candidatus Sulfopaludibacter sp. SbA4]
MEVTLSWQFRALALTTVIAWPLTQSGLAQGTRPTVLQVQVENFVNYYNDVTDWSKLAKNPNATPPAGSVPNFALSLDVADIVSVNGDPAKGVFTERRIQYKRTVTPTPGQFIADSVSSAIQDRYFEILKADGTPIGSIAVTGMGGAVPAPGTPSVIADGNFTIVGGTGAFMGARGQAGGLDEPSATGARSASMTEDPSYRRALPSGHRLMVLQIIPLERPEVVLTANGPAVVHSSDFSLVATAKPAKAGEILSLIATGLGPTQTPCPSTGGTGGTAGTTCTGVTVVEPGDPFPAAPLALVNSPVSVTVGGQPAEVLYAGGYPGTTDTYQVNFRMPAGVPSGAASLQVSAAWIAGSAVSIAAQ